MEHVQININTKTYDIVDLAVRKLIERESTILFILDTSIIHELSIGQSLVFRRQLYRQDGGYHNLDYKVEIVDLYRYLDENGQYYDAIETTKVDDKRLRIDKSNTIKFTYYELSGATYYSATTASVSLSDYVLIDDSDIEYYSGLAEELDEEHYETFEYKHLYSTGITSNGVTHIDIVYHQADTVPPEYDYYDSPYLSGMTPGETVDSFVASHPDEFPYFSGMSVGQTISEYMEANPELFEFDQHDEKYVITFTENHDIFYQDVRFINGVQNLSEYNIIVYDVYGDIIGYLGGLQFLHEISNISLDVDDFYTTTTAETCGIYDEIGMPYNILFHNYFFLPTDISLNRIAITEGISNRVQRTPIDTDRTYRNRQIEYLLENGFEFVPRYNPFYYTYFSDEQTNGVFWVDVLWDYFEENNNITPQKDVWVNCGTTKSVLTYDNSYFRVSVNGLFDVSQSLGLEDDINKYINNVTDSLIPETIDFERVKYVPIVYDKYTQNPLLVDEMIFNFHFRKRQETSASTKQYPQYEKGWYINQDSGNTIWWNEMDYTGTSFDTNKMYEFIADHGEQSDLLGYLGFDDDDVYNQKTKIRETFMRLSFYTSTDPTEQKLLYYSTVYFDSAKLFGEYMKQKIRRNELKTNNNTPIVFEKNNERLDSRITITSEYDTTTSSEGFNLYLFKDDVVENGFRTIYMKVEFNHAGCGKTIPMMIWPINEDGDYKPVTIDNFLQSLYIPVYLRYIDGKYTYEIGGGDIYNNSIIFTLFEPKIDIEQVTEFDGGSTINPPSEEIPVGGDEI